MHPTKRGAFFITMPIQPNPIDEIIIEALASSIDSAQVATDRASSREALLNSDRLIHAISKITGIEDEAGHPFMLHRFNSLRDIAYGQEMRILHGCRRYLEKLGMTKQEIIPSLLNTRVMGRQFGRIGGQINDQGDKADNHIPNAILLCPEICLTYSAEDGLDFSEPIKSLIRECSKPGTGCPIMGNVASWDGTKQNMYDMFWDEFAQDYTTKYANDMPITFEYQD